MARDVQGYVRWFLDACASVLGLCHLMKVVSGMVWCDPRTCAVTKRNGPTNISQQSFVRPRTHCDKGEVHHREVAAQSEEPRERHPVQ